MSATAILQATRDHLRKELGLEPGECQVRPGWEPPHLFGNIFFSVWLSEQIIAVNNPDDAFHESFRLSVSITIPSRKSAPGEQMDRFYLDQVDGLSAAQDKVRRKIDLNYDLLTKANAYLLKQNQEDEQGFVVPLRWESQDAVPRPVTGQEIGLPEPSVPQQIHAFLRIDVNFGRCIRPRSGTLP